MVVETGDSEPQKMFERTANLIANQIINYRCDASEKWLVLIGIAPGAPEVFIYIANESLAVVIFVTLGTLFNRIMAPHISPLSIIDRFALNPRIGVICLV